jgi:hypothetical protein
MGCAAPEGHSFVGPVLIRAQALTYNRILDGSRHLSVNFRTRTGLRIRALGMTPQAAASVGINVKKIRGQAYIYSGIFAALGGAFMTMGYLSYWAQNMMGGRGFIGISAANLSGGNVLLGTVTAVLFGATSALSIVLQTLNLKPELMQMLPYIATIIGLVVISVVQKKRDDAIVKKAAMHVSIERQAARRRGGNNASGFAPHRIDRSKVYLFLKRIVSNEVNYGLFGSRQRMVDSVRFLVAGHQTGSFGRTCPVRIQRIRVWTDSARWYAMSALTSRCISYDWILLKTRGFVRHLGEMRSLQSLLPGLLRRRDLWLDDRRHTSVRTGADLGYLNTTPEVIGEHSVKSPAMGIYLAQICDHVFWENWRHQEARTSSTHVGD